MSRKFLTGIILLTAICIEAIWITGIVSGPTFLRLFNITKTHLGITFSLASFAMLLISPFIGGLIRRAGSTRLFAAGLFVQLSGILLIIFSTNFGMIMTGMAIVGISSALIVNITISFLADLFPEKIRRATSMYSFTYLTSSGLTALLIGQWLKIAGENQWDFWSFRMPYVFFVILLIPVIILSFRYILKEPLFNKRYNETLTETYGNTVKKASVSRRKAFLIVAMGFLHGLIFHIILTWSNPMIQDKFMADEFKGALSIGIITMAVAISRFIMAGFELKKEDRTLLAFGTITGSILLLSGIMSQVYVKTLMLMGAGMFMISVSFPCIFSIATRHYGMMKTRVFGYIYGAIALGGICGNPVVGALADSGYPLWKIFLGIPFMAFLLGIISILWKYSDRKRGYV